MDQLPPYTPSPEPIYLSDSERRQIAEILERRANDVASFRYDLGIQLGVKLQEFPGSVQLAMSREVERLRLLASRVKPPAQPSDEE